MCRPTTSGNLVVSRYARAFVTRTYADDDIER
jgi:hypothetical protein